MRIFIDRAAVRVSRLVNSAVANGETRNYYLIAVDCAPDAIIVVRGGLALESFDGRVADATVGWDIAQPGFALDDQIGQQRTKVTLYRPLPGSGQVLADRGEE